MPENLPVEFVGVEEQTSEVTLADVVAEIRGLRRAVEALTAATVCVVTLPAVDPIVV